MAIWDADAFAAFLFAVLCIWLNKFRQPTASTFLCRRLGNVFRLAFQRACPAQNNACCNT
jgi:hypothetical protein